MFLNINQCKSFNQNLTTSLAGFSSMECSEVIVSNKTGQNILLFDNNNFLDSNGFLLSNGETFTFLGVSDSSQLSAKTASGSGSVYYRTHLFSSTPIR